MHVTRPVSWTLCFLLAGCAFGGQHETIADQLKPSGPCWEVDLSDGLDDQSTKELHSLFSCLNRTGNLEAFVELDQAMDVSNRDGEPIGLSLISLSNFIAEDEVDMLGLAGKALEILQIDRDASTSLLRFMVELIYGVPFDAIDDNFDWQSDTALSAGLVKPMVHLSSDVSADIIDGGSSTRLAIRALLENDTIEDAICLIDSLGLSSNSEHTKIVDHLMTDAADAWQQADNADNNLWTGSSGNSLRDLTQSVISFRKTDGYNRFRTELFSLLSDVEVRLNTRDALRYAADEGHIEHIASQLAHLTSVDATGRDLTHPLARNASALQVGVKLIHDANQPLACDLWLFEVNIENMATRILRELGQLETDEVESSLDFMVNILDGELTPALLETAAATGVCSGFTPELLQDLDVLERLNDAEVGNLVEVMHSLLDAVYEEGRVDRLPELVNMVSEVHISGLMLPIQEVLRDLHSTQIVHNASSLVPILIDTDGLEGTQCDDDSQPLEFDQVWTELLRMSSGDALPEDNAVQLLETVVERNDFWLIIDKLVALVHSPTSSIHSLSAAMDEVENQSIAVDSVAFTNRILENQESWETVFMTLENESIRDSLTKDAEEGPSPLPFVANLILSDTVTVMLQTIDLLLDSLTED